MCRGEKHPATAAEVDDCCEQVVLMSRNRWNTVKLHLECAMDEKIREVCERKER